MICRFCFDLSSNWITTLCVYSWLCGIVVQTTFMVFNLTNRRGVAGIVGEYFAVHQRIKMFNLQFNFVRFKTDYYLPVSVLFARPIVWPQSVTSSIFTLLNLNNNVRPYISRLNSFAKGSFVFHVSNHSVLSRVISLRFLNY